MPFLKLFLLVKKKLNETGENSKTFFLSLRSGDASENTFLKEKQQLVLCCLYHVVVYFFPEIVSSCIRNEDYH